eukprot:Nk52_evm2s2243 gene=Nk52_evmTU2s2243
MSDPQPKLPSLESINNGHGQDQQQKLKEATSLLFETTPYLFGELTKKKPFGSYEQLIKAAEEIISASSDEQKCEILSAHPMIGQTKALSALSAAEQGHTTAKSATNANNTTSAEVLAELARLNDEYIQKFGFKFVVFVAGRSRAEIVPVFQERLSNNTREVEMEIGLKAMIDIAFDRLKKLQ